MSEEAQQNTGDTSLAKELGPANESAKNQASQDIASSEANDIEHYIETYHAVSEWIRFADAKAAVVLTVGGALAGFLIPTLKEVLAEPTDGAHMFSQWRVTALVLFGLYTLCFAGSSLFAFLCINPIRKRGQHPSLGHCDHFHPAAISAKYKDDQVEEFVRDCDKRDAKEVRHEIQAALLLDAHISSRKYIRVLNSIKFFTASVVFGFLYFLVIQF